jgi:hypothetical protein
MTKQNSIQDIDDLERNDGIPPDKGRFTCHVGAWPQEHQEYTDLHSARGSAIQRRNRLCLKGCQDRRRSMRIDRSRL